MCWARCCARYALNRSGFSGVCLDRATRPEPLVPFGAGRPLGLWPKRRTRAGRRAGRVYLCLTSKRIRHQPECPWNQTLADPCAPVSGAGNSGDEPGGRRTCSSMAGRNVGGTNSAGPVFHPSNGDRCRFQFQSSHQCDFGQPMTYRIIHSNSPYNSIRSRCALRSSGFVSLNIMSRNSTSIAVIPDSL